jgi:hypothetical protein
MYELKADDGNVYGPVDEGNILEWAKSGRIDGNSLVRKTPDGEWLPLNQIEELSYICRQAAESPVPPSPPTIPAAAPVAAATPGGQPTKPGKIQAISIMTLVGGIVATLAGLTWGCYISLIGLATLGIGFILLFMPIYSLVFGIMAIIKGSQMLGSNPLPAFKSAKTTAIMQIVNIICCDLINLTMGIVNLVFLNDPEVKDYLRSEGVEI